MRLDKVLEVMEDLNTKTKKQVKADVDLLLLVSHVIQKNKSRLQTTACNKIAEAIYHERKEKGVDCVEYTVVDNKTGHKVVGDLKEAMYLFNLFKASGQIELTKNGKIILNEFTKPEIPTYSLPKHDKQTAVFIKGAFNDQKLPSAIERLSSVKYEIDTRVRDMAEEIGTSEYMEHLALSTTYNFEDKPFNFHYYCDSRLRCYTDNTNGFSPQSNDLGKALIKNEKKVANRDLTDDFVALAQEYFGKKCPFYITKDNLTMLPFEEAEYPWLLFQLQEDYKEYLWTGETSANIYLDARSSGTQILSILGCNEDVVDYIGMMPVEADLDFYEVHSKALYQKVLEDNKEVIELNKHLVDEERGMFVRDIGKRPVMTFYYNATLLSIIKEFRKLKVNNSTVVYLAKQMKEVLASQSGKNYLIMEWLKECAKIISKAGHKTIQWTLPDGTIASQTYVKQKTLSVSKSIPMTEQEIRKKFMMTRKKPVNGWYHNMRVSLKVPHLNLNGQEEVDWKKAVNAITANFIHSLDGWVGKDVIDGCAEKDVEVTRFIHDQLATHMNYKQELYDCIVETHIKLSKMDYLAQVKEEWEMLYGVKLPELPEKGTYNAEILRECNNFWE